MTERRLSLDNIEYALHRSQHVLQVDLDRLPHHIDNLQTLLNHYHNNSLPGDTPQLLSDSKLNDIVKELTHTSKTIEQLVAKLSELKRLRNRIECKKDQTRIDYNIDVTALRNSALICLNDVSDIVQLNLSRIDKPSTSRHQRFKEQTWNIWKKIENDLEQLKSLLEEINDCSSDVHFSSHQEYQNSLNPSTSTPPSSPPSQWKTRLQQAALPLSGAAIGAVMAGPVGFMVGAKVGAAVGLLGGGVVGLTGGGIVSKVHEHLQSHKRITSEKLELSSLLEQDGDAASVSASCCQGNNSSNAMNSTLAPSSNPDIIIPEAITPVNDGPYGSLVLTDSVDNPERTV